MGVFSFAPADEWLARPAVAALGPPFGSACPAESACLAEALGFPLRWESGSGSFQQCFDFFGLQEIVGHGAPVTAA